MYRCDNILKNELYRSYLEKNKELEKDRIFCRHDMNHFIDTARIGYIIILERGLLIEKHMIYAAALVHDIARCVEQPNLPHDEASARFAEEILPECGFTEEEVRAISSAVRAHRLKPTDMTTLGGVLYAADKLSRKCYECAAYSQCNWSAQKRNDNVTY